MVATFYVYTDPIDRAQYRTHDPTNPTGRAYYMTWDQIKEMDSAGMTIASHTLSHPHLNRLSAEERERELVESKRALEEKLGKSVFHFAVPYGYASPNVIASVKAAGYTTCRTTNDGVYHTRDHLLKLRANVVTDDVSDFVNVLNQ